MISLAQVADGYVYKKQNKKKKGKKWLMGKYIDGAPSHSKINVK